MFSSSQVRQEGMLMLCEPIKAIIVRCRLPPELPEAHRVLILQMVLKVADLGHLSHPHDLHKVCSLQHLWSACLLPSAIAHHAAAAQSLMRLPCICLTEPEA